MLEGSPGLPSSSEMYPLLPVVPVAVVLERVGRFEVAMLKLYGGGGLCAGRRLFAGTLWDPLREE